jgi:exopolysaccharide production protein ExoY
MRKGGFVFREFSGSVVSDTASQSAGTTAPTSLFVDINALRDTDAIRVIDVAVALVGLIVFGPLMCLIALAISVTSGGPMLYRQRRIGIGGREFVCFKFRTMHRDADQLLDSLLMRCARSRSEWERDQKLRRDPRVILIGRTLRRTSLDELPQLFNVLRGDMSIVGPRPIVIGEAHRYGRHLRSYTAVRPGITGLWQVSGRNSTTYRRRVACDVIYARKQSIKANIAIMARTIPVIFTGRGAF